MRKASRINVTLKEESAAREQFVGNAPFRIVGHGPTTWLLITPD